MAICPEDQEERFINRLDIGYTNNKLSDNDKSKIRPEFIRLQMNILGNLRGLMNIKIIIHLDLLILKVILD